MPRRLRDCGWPCVQIRVRLLSRGIRIRRREKTKRRREYRRGRRVAPRSCRMLSGSIFIHAFVNECRAEPACYAAPTTPGLARVQWRLHNHRCPRVQSRQRRVHLPRRVHCAFAPAYQQHVRASTAASVQSCPSPHMRAIMRLLPVPNPSLILTCSPGLAPRLAPGLAPGLARSWFARSDPESVNLVDLQGFAADHCRKARLVEAYPLADELITHLGNKAKANDFSFNWSGYDVLAARA